MSRVGRRATVVTAVCLLVAGISFASAESEEVPEGLWGAERVFPPAASIHVIIEPDGDALRARAAGYGAPVKTSGDSIRFTMPHGLGSFRGTRSHSADEISGHWISEPGGLVYSPLAIPLTLTSSRKRIWQGSVQPMEQRFSIYIPVQRDEAGVLRAFLRNPERNQGVYTRLSSVTRQGSQVSFLDQESELALAGRLDEASGLLSVFMPWRGGSYDLTRRDRSSAAGFYPRRDTDAYRYSAPADLGDGWQVARAAAVGVDEARLTELVQGVLRTQTTSLRSPYIHSVLVARHGKLILDEYFYGHHSERTHDLRSASKSVTGLMVGRMLSENRQFSVETPVYPLFGDFSEPDDARKSTLNLAHLLSMRGGFACDDNDYATPGHEDRMQEQTGQPDWRQFTLALPLSSMPGESAAYCSGAINLLGGVISNITDTWLPEFFRTRFAEPMQIDNYYFNLDPLKRGYAGGGMHMRPRDFLKFAQIMLDDGVWNGHQVVPAKWVRESFDAHASIYAEDDYGYTWWRGTLAVDGRNVAVYSATGNGGQLLVIVPELDIVVGFTGGNYGDFRTWIKWRDALVPDYILDAISE